MKDMTIKDVPEHVKTGLQLIAWMQETFDKGEKIEISLHYHENR